MMARARIPRGKLPCLMRMPCGGYKNVSPNLSARSDAMTLIAPLADKELQVADLYALARCDFGTFVELAFPILHWQDACSCSLSGCLVCAYGRRRCRPRAPCNRQSATG